MKIGVNDPEGTVDSTVHSSYEWSDVTSTDPVLRPLVPVGVLRSRVVGKVFHSVRPVKRHTSEGYVDTLSFLVLF